MERRIGTISRGLRAPIIKEGDDLKKIVVDTLMSCVDNGDFEIGKKDVLAVTESILARSQANYATTEQLAEDVKNKLGGIPYTQQKQIRHMLKRHSQGRKENSPDAQLSQRRGRKPSFGSGPAG